MPNILDKDLGMKIKENWQKADKETLIFILFLIGMAVYYGSRLFGLIPWYDELYTYYYFISRGPVYAAIHWPLPNNHVGYSVLSACLGIFGNSAVALRGVSYISSLMSLILLYRIGRKVFRKGFALIPVFFYAGLDLVNRLAVQGRGYALVACCYLTAVWELIHIAVEHRGKKRDYFIFGSSLILALYAIPSSVYMVIPVCVTGGVVLLLQKEYKRLWKLILASLVSAFCTLGLYGILWLAIGSNLLSKIPDSVYYDMSGHVEIILRAPVRSLVTGIRYMLDTPYIQSVPREGFFLQFQDWLRTLFGTHFSFIMSGGGILYGVSFAVGAVLLLRNVIVRFRRKEPFSYAAFMEWFFLISIVLMPLMLIIQCTLPYYRVFSFAGAMVAMFAVWLLLQAGRLSEKMLPYLGLAGSVIACIVCVFSLHSAGAYSLRDEYLAEAYGQIDMEEAGTIAVTDCDQEYLLLYLYGIGEGRVTRRIEDADTVVFDKNLLGLEYDYREMPETWKFYMAKEEVPKEYIEQEMEKVYENWHFVLYQKK